MKSSQAVLLVNILVMLLSSCGLASNPPDLTSVPTPDVGIDVKMGQYLEVTAPEGWNSFKTRESINIEIRNTSEQQIALEPDAGLRLFVRSDKGWIEVKNKAQYLYKLITLEPNKNSDPMKNEATFVYPDLTDDSITSFIRIVVIGNLIEDGKAIGPVGTYIDIQLNP